MTLNNLLKKWNNLSRHAWFKGGFYVSFIVLIVLNFFLFYSIIFGPEGILVTWFIGILLYPLYFLVRIISGVSLEGSWILLILSFLFYVIISFGIGAIIGSLIGRKNRK